MAALAGYDGHYGLRGWPPGDPAAAPVESVSDDLSHLRETARSLIEDGRCARVEIRAWNFELNDWVRIADLSLASSGSTGR